MILLTTFAQPPSGEVTALERRDIDLDAGTVDVRRALVEVPGKCLWPGDRVPPPRELGPGDRGRAGRPCAVVELQAG
jgi:hypothetical protein